ncbi:hypothetical protein [Thermaerobacillus caldiproteolyticus]|nr:hypothetical protein [Anoxybacillus caldiproteolyticus]
MLKGCCDLAEVGESSKLGGLKVKADVDVSDMLKGLKSLRREEDIEGS